MSWHVWGLLISFPEQSRRTRITKTVVRMKALWMAVDTSWAT